MQIRNTRCTVLTGADILPNWLCRRIVWDVEGAWKERQ
jgi:hypothetical protein